MNQDKYIFSQLTAFLDRSKFNRIVAKYKGDHYVKHFTCWNQMLAMIFGQLSNRVSLRDLIVALDAHRSKCYHLGVGKLVTKTTLARANQDRDCRIFEDFAYHMIAEAQRKRATDIFKLGGNVYAFDSTTIDLCLSVFWWAKFRKKKGGVKAHVLYDIEAQVPKFFHITNASVHDSMVMKEMPVESGSYYIFDRAYNNFKQLFRIHHAGGYFVVRAKKNLKYETVSWKRRLPKNVRSDSTIKLTVYKSGKDYPPTLRRVVYWDEEQKREFVFLTNTTHISALQVANLYKNRWQIELFFKWLKQHLKIKKFWGTTENAVRIQIYCAIIAYCLVAIIQKDMQIERSTYEVLQILGISLTDKAHLRDLLDKTKSQNANDLFRPDGPNLFDF